MKIEILGTESLGVRGLCCFVTTKNQKILIDPGIALGFMRYKLLPHPLQVAVDEKIQKQIIKAWTDATDIVISHFHGDHIPLVNANPYQLNIEKIAGLNPKAKIWAKLSHLSPTEKKRAESLSLILNKNLIPAEEKKQEVFHFSKAVPHGMTENNLETVMMTKIEEDYTFVHASDIQLLNNESVSQIVSWKPNIVLASGPPLYLSVLSKDQIRNAWQNALRISESVDTLIIDHHLLRDDTGIQWLRELSSKSNKIILCGADFMNKPRMLLEAQRKDLYEQMPVPEGWHEAYGQGKVNTDYYWNLAKKYYNGIELDDEK
jgi:predicted metallo-beta-lactamase superfamily hydrolase